MCVLPIHQRSLTSAPVQTDLDCLGATQLDASMQHVNVEASVGAKKEATNTATQLWMEGVVWRHT